MFFVFTRNMRIMLTFALVIVGLAGCADNQARQSASTDTQSVPPLGNVEYHTYMLANELFAGMTPRQAKYAVTGFVPVTTMAYESDFQSPLMLLGHQLEEGMITEATKRGYTPQEFKLSDDIIMGEDSDRVLTRNIELLPGIDRVDFYITGTLVRQQAGAMVNARIINARTKDVVAAATRFFPDELFWKREQVTTRNGRLYRTEDKG